MSDRVIVVMPAFNAGKTLELTYKELPQNSVDMVILVDDGSSDNTIEVARSLDLQIVVHNGNYGYGANQKTCYQKALEADASIVVMLHPDYQYDPSLLPKIIAPIRDGRADLVLGSRFMGQSPVEQGMPRWKYWGNLMLTRLENTVFGLQLKEFHTGYRAFSRSALESIPFHLNSNQFVFDQQIIAQLVAARQRIVEIPVPTRYFPESSSASLIQSLRYGISILWMLARYWCHVAGLARQSWLQPVEKS